MAKIASTLKAHRGGKFRIESRGFYAGTGLSESIGMHHTCACVYHKEKGSFQSSPKPREPIFRNNTTGSVNNVFPLGYGQICCRVVSTATGIVKSCARAPAVALSVNSAGVESETIGLLEKDRILRTRVY